MSFQNTILKVVFFLLLSFLRHKYPFFKKWYFKRNPIFEKNRISCSTNPYEINPRNKSACKSSTSSKPTDMRMSPSLIPAARRCSGVIRV